MTPERALVYFFWMTPIVVQSVMAVHMLVRRVHRALPSFFVYTCFVVLSSLLQLAMHPREHTYFPSYEFHFYAFWVEDAISILLGLMVVAELFNKLFEPYQGLRHLGTVLFRWAALVMVLVAAAGSAALPNTDPAGILGNIFAVERAMRVIQIGLLAFLFLFSSYFELKPRDLCFGIALGFALYAGVDIAATATRSHFGPSATTTLSWIRSLAYNCAVFVWAVYVLRREAVAKTARTLPPSELHRWNDALQELLHQ